MAPKYTVAALEAAVSHEHRLISLLLGDPGGKTEGSLGFGRIAAFGWSQGRRQP